MFQGKSISIGFNHKVKLLVIAILVPIALSFSLAIGRYPINLFNLDSTALGILFDIRLPRVIMCIIAGAVLGACGAVLQSIFRNPLVSPYIFFCISLSLKIYTPSLLSITPFNVPIIYENNTYYLSFIVPTEKQINITIARTTDNLTLRSIIIHIKTVQRNIWESIDPWVLAIILPIVAYAGYLYIRRIYSSKISRRYLIEKSKKL